MGAYRQRGGTQGCSVQRGEVFVGFTGSGCPTQVSNGIASKLNMPFSVRYEFVIPNCKRQGVFSFSAWTKLTPDHQILQLHQFRRQCQIKFTNYAPFCRGRDWVPDFPQ